MSDGIFQPVQLPTVFSDETFSIRQDKSTQAYADARPEIQTWEKERDLQAASPHHLQTGMLRTEDKYAPSTDYLSMHL